MNPMKEGASYYTNRHSCFLLQYHLVLVTKYRHPVITGELETDLYGIIREMMEDRGLNLLEINSEPDHVHVLFEADPFTAPGEFVNALKTKTSRLIRKKYAGSVLRPYYWKPCFWSKSYFVTTVSERSLKAVTDYIRNQRASESSDSPAPIA